MSTEDAWPGPDELRIGDGERESAMSALGEHLSAGRIDIDEYGERSGKVTEARTRRQLLALFADLPEPHPRFDAGSVPLAGESAVVPAAGGQVAERPPGGSAAQRVAGSLMGVSWMGAIALIVVTHMGWLIFIPIALSVVFGSIWGKGWRHEVHHGRHDDHDGLSTDRSDWDRRDRRRRERRDRRDR